MRLGSQTSFFVKKKQPNTKKPLDENTQNAPTFFGPICLPKGFLIKKGALGVP